MSQPEKRLFAEVNVWRAIDETELVVYRCLHILPDNLYAVKGVDHYHSPLTLDQVRERDFYFVDSMFDGGLDYAVSEACPSLEAAIDKFENQV